MSVAYWQETQRILQGSPPLVRRPKLTDALLQKSPFRFLHDVISEVQRNTGFATDLYNGSELDARAFQDRTGKVAYLQKIFDAVSTTLQQPVPADPSQVVAGQDPEKTNKFLQMLAQAAIKGNVPQRFIPSANPSAQALHPDLRLKTESDRSSRSDTPKVAGCGPPKRRNRERLQMTPNQARKSTEQHLLAGSIDGAQSLEKLCSAIAKVNELAGQLSDCMDGVDEDAEACRAQTRFWEGEAKAYEEQLEDVKLMHNRTMTAISAESSTLDAKIEAALQRVRALEFEKQCYAEKISLLGGHLIQDKGSVRPS